MVLGAFHILPSGLSASAPGQGTRQDSYLAHGGRQEHIRILFGARGPVGTRQDLHFARVGPQDRIRIFILRTEAGRNTSGSLFCRVVKGPDSSMGSFACEIRILTRENEGTDWHIGIFILTLATSTNPDSLIPAG